jgi:hypothetical protein
VAPSSGLSAPIKEKEGLVIVHEPEIIEKGGEIQISSRIQIEDSGGRFPQTLWFRFPDSLRDFVTDRSDAFAVALLPLAMERGEEMRIRGVVSPRLAIGMTEYQRIQTSWHPNHFKTIDIEYGTLAVMDPSQTGDGVASAFSGGVDSFYTLHSHVFMERIQQYRISYCLMINGFDFNHDDIEDCRLFDQTTKLYRPLLNELDVELLVSHTNITPFLTESLRAWNIHGFSHGAYLTASALVLGQLLRCLFIPSSDRYTELHPYGSHPLLDNHLSTETMETITDGAHAGRFEKTARLAKWPAVYSRLRVCNRGTRFNASTGALENCCRCEKCIRTMAALEVVGALNQFTVFPESLNGVRIRRTVISKLVRSLWIQIGRQALKKKRLSLCVDTCLALLLSPLRKAKRRLLSRLKKSFLKILRGG